MPPGLALLSAKGTGAAPEWRGRVSYRTEFRKSAVVGKSTRADQI
jgi:hypothetical protein